MYRVCRVVGAAGVAVRVYTLALYCSRVLTCVPHSYVALTLQYGVASAVLTTHYIVPSRSCELP